VAALVAPGAATPTLRAHAIDTETIDDWTDEGLKLMIEEGRRQVDRQLADLDRIRTRAQWLFSLSVAATAALGTAFVARQPPFVFGVIWITGLILLTWALGGAAAIIVTRAEFKQITTALLSATDQPVLRSLAAAYSRMTGTGEDTVATRISVFHQAVLFALAGGYLGLISALAS